MWKRTLFLFLFSFPALSSSDCDDSGKVYKFCSNQEETYSKALEAAKAEKKKLLVVIGAEWCPWCLSLHKILGDSKLDKNFSKRFSLADIALYRAKEKIPSGLAVQEKLKIQAGFKEKLAGIPVLAMVNPENGKTVLIDTLPLEKNTKTQKGHDAKKVLAALEKAEKNLR